MTVTELTAAAKGRLAERMVPVAAALACAVREECADSIGEVLEPFSRQDLYGLLVVLAGMVPVDQPVGDLLAWADGLEPHEAVSAPPQPKLPPRLADYADLRSWDVPREEIAGRMGVKVETTYDYDYRLAKRREAAA